MKRVCWAQKEKCQKQANYCLPLHKVGTTVVYIIEKMEPDSSQSCTAKGPEATDMVCSMAYSNFI